MILLFHLKRIFQPLVNDIIEIIPSKAFKVSHDKTLYQTKLPKVTNVIVKNNGLYLAESYKAKIDAFEDKETASAKGTINYYNPVRKISKTKSSAIKEKFFNKI